MKTLFRMSLVAGFVGVLVGGAGYACPTWSAHLGLNLTEWFVVRQRLEYERRRRETLDHQTQVALEKLITKAQVVEELCDHRRTLLEAAARFRDLAHPGLCSEEWFRMAYPGQTEEERWCRQVISFVRGGDLGPAKLTYRADQLEVELTYHLTHGTLHLPD